MKELCPAEALHEECGVFGIYDSTGKTNMVSAVYSIAVRKAAALP